MPAEPVTVVGIGADGWEGLSPVARSVVESAEVLMGSARQLSLVPSGSAERLAWPSPLSEALPALLEEHTGRRVCVLASGDPTFHGIGTTLTRLLGADAVRVIPHPSSVSLACARLGWPQDQVQVVSLVGHPVERVHTHVQPGRRLVILSWGSHTPAEVAALLTERGYGSSELTVLEQLGGPSERVRTSRAAEWSDEVDALNVVGVLCLAGEGAQLLPTVPGLPDDAYESDGQLTKREVRAVTLSRLAPVPGKAPAALEGLETPDAVFVGGGATAPGMIETCWNALAPGGRLVVNGVTLETEA